MKTLKLCILAGILTIASACQHGNVISDSEEQIEYDVLVIDSCEYILVQSVTYGELYVTCVTHKGNCKFCKERRNNEKMGRPL
jgi:hypothetical protein